MKRLILLILLSISMTTFAQSSYFEIVQVCETDNAYLLTVETVPEVYQLSIMPSHTATIERAIDHAGAYRFAISKANEWVELRAFIQDSQPIEMLYFEELSACDSAAPSIPMNECLGLSPESLELPNTGVFTVDNAEYSYNDKLSFLVPSDSYWLWNFSAYGLSFQFAQSEDEACHIIGGD